MIVRESPKKRAPNTSQQWPPKSPHDALLSSPSGRRKYAQRLERNSVSPSPTKRRHMTHRSGERKEEEEDEDEDEETLQLKLQAIEARLKLKKLQKARKDGDTEAGGIRPQDGQTPSMKIFDLPKPRSNIQVPASPTRNRKASEDPKSPARVLLGIDKGLRAQDVSLKRPLSFANRDRVGEASKALSRAASAASNGTNGARSKSFSERLAESRKTDKEKEEKQARIEKSRSVGFGLQNISGVRGGPPSRSGSALGSETVTLHKSHDSKRTTGRGQGRPLADMRTESISRSRSDLKSSQTPATTSNVQEDRILSATASKYAEVVQRDDSNDAPSFESFSGLHLKSREMQHNIVARTLEDKTIVTIPQLLKSVKAPEYEPPDVENDFVVLGVVASKSTPMTPKNAVKDRTTGEQQAATHQSNKFMVLKLTDLKWELDLFLFDTGFSQFWKLQLGTLIAILNPEIMAPRQRDSGRFSLKLASSDDTVLEIGQVRDLDFCHAMRKDGKECGQWIDGRKTEFCDFHIELHVEKSKRGRMEVNTMTGFGKGAGGGGRGGMFGTAQRGGGTKGQELRREGKYHDRMLHETIYLAPGVGGAARLLDRDEQPWEETTRAERHRKQLAGREKERELAKKLADIGNGASSAYMKSKDAASHKDSLQTGLSAEAEPSAKDGRAAHDLQDLLGRRADDVSLSPAKRKRIASGKSTSSSEPVGWGGAFKRGLLLSPAKQPSIESALRNGREPSPAKKRARLLLPEKGIREPGRESLGNLDAGLIAAMDDDDDDDDLEVV